ncbi:MAG: hypothetical protein ACYDA1_03880 [Vulcanimicrobiaceae bacterium]
MSLGIGLALRETPYDIHDLNKLAQIVYALCFTFTMIRENPPHVNGNEI